MHLESRFLMRVKLPFHALKPKLAIPQMCYLSALNPSPTGHYQGTHNRTPVKQVLRYLSKVFHLF